MTFQYTTIGGPANKGAVKGGLFGDNPAAFWISSEYRARRSTAESIPYEHLGIDIACPFGTNLYMPADGYIAGAGDSDIYGHYLIFEFVGGGAMLIAHLSKPAPWRRLLFRPEREGRFLKKGTFLGQSGNTGLVLPDPDGPPLDPVTGDHRGSHVHVQMTIGHGFQVWNQTTDPLLYLKILDGRTVR